MSDRLFAVQQTMRLILFLGKKQATYCALCFLACTFYPNQILSKTPTPLVEIQLDRIEFNDGVLVTAKLSCSDNKIVRTKIRCYVMSTLGEPVQDGLFFTDVVPVNGDTLIQFSIKPRTGGDFQLRIVVEPEFGGVSHSQLRFIRFDKKRRGTVFDYQQYSYLRANERAEKSNFGLKDARWRGWKPRSSSEDLMEGSLEDTIKRNKPKIIIGEGKSEIKRADVSVSATSDRITILGNIKTVLNGKNVPLHYTEIHVYDYDPITPDDLLGTTRTDNQGNYNINVKNDDGPGGGGVDVYLYIFSKNKKIATLYLVPDGVGGYTPVYYSWRSTTHDNLTGDRATIDFTLTSDKLASTVWSGGSAAQWLTEANTEKMLSYIEIRFPGFGAGTYYRNNIINIDSSLGDSPETVGHEYGHGVMKAAYGSRPAQAGGAHSFCVSATPGLTWSEGFATWYGMAAWDGDGTFVWHLGGTGVSIENWSCSIDDANVDEGRSAAWLWDLYDIPTDNNAGVLDRGRSGFSDSNSGQQIVGTSVIINTLWKRKQNDTKTYWTDLQTNLTNTQKAPSTEISKYNYLESIN